MKTFAIISSIFAGATGIQVSTKKSESSDFFFMEKLGIEASIQVSESSDFNKYRNAHRFELQS